MIKHSRPTSGDTVIDSRKGMRQVVRQHVLDHIRDGTWTVGQKLPTGAELAKRFNTSPSNVTQAMKSLEQEGIVRRYRRTGTFVARAPSVASATTLPRTAGSQQGCVQVITPLGVDDPAMQWKHAALTQIESVLNAAGLQTAHVSLANMPTPQAFEEVIHRTRSSRTSGLIILTNLVHADHGSQDGEMRLLPFVKILLKYPARICWMNHNGYPLTSWPFDAVSMSPFDEGLAVGQYLLEQGVTDIVCMGRRDVAWGRMRMAGLEMAVEEAPRTMRIEKHWIDGQKMPTELFDQILTKALKRTGPRRTFVPPNDFYAAHFLDRARARGVKCPADICLVSYGNDDRFRDHNITTLTPQANRMGELIGQLMTNQIRHPSGTAVHMTHKPVIIERLTFALDHGAPDHGKMT